MSWKTRFTLLVIAEIIAVAIIASISFAAPKVLQDSDTSSANPKGTNTTGKPTAAMNGPFDIHCYDTTTFAKNIKKKEAILIMTGFDADDNSLILTFKLKDGSLAMARTNKEGTMTCQYATVMEPQYDIRAVLNNKESSP